MRWSGLLSSLNLQSELATCQLPTGSGPWPVLTPRCILSVARMSKSCPGPKMCQEMF